MDCLKIPVSDGIPPDVIHEDCSEESAALDLRSENGQLTHLRAHAPRLVYSLENLRKRRH